MKVQMKKYLIIPLLILLQIQFGCSLNRSKTYVNENIDSRVKSEIDSLNQIVFTAILSDEVLPIHKNLHSGLKNNSNINSLVNFLFNNYPDLQLNKYNEFYIISDGTGERNANFFSFTDDNFFVSLKVWSPEIYVSLHETKNLEKDVLISLVYEKEKGKWKIRNFHVGERRNFGKTFHQWIAEAYSDYKTSKKFSAFIKILGVQSMLKPAPFVEYVLEDSIKSMIDELTKETFPREAFSIKFDDIISKPEIYSIRHQPINDVKDILPVFNYKTNYSLEAVDSLESEVNLMAGKLKKKFPGIEGQFSTILFCATKEFPTVLNKNLENYNLVYKFN